MSKLTDRVHLSKVSKSLIADTMITSKQTIVLCHIVFPPLKSKVNMTDFKTKPILNSKVILQSLLRMAKGDK